MKRRHNESVEAFKGRIAKNLPAGMSPEKAGPSDWITAKYKTTHPRLTKNLRFSVGAVQGSGRGVGGYAILGDSPKPGETLKQWGNRKPRFQTVVTKPQKTHEAAAFVIAHELRHVADSRGKTNAKIMRSVMLQRAFVPYGFRPTEWRANAAGAKAAGKIIANKIPITAKTGERIFKATSAATNTGLGLAGTAVRAAPVVAAAVLYKRHLKKKRAAAAQAA